MTLAMKTIKILTWCVLAIQITYMTVEFCAGNIGFGLNCFCFAIMSYLFICAITTIKDKNKIIANTPRPYNIKSNFVAEIEQEVKEGTCHYNWFCDESAYYVYLYKLEGYQIPIKVFPFDNDKEYALLCAEELIEKLNEC